MDTQTSAKISKLAKSMKDLHLVGTSEEALERAKEIILGTNVKNNEKPIGEMMEEINKEDLEKIKKELEEKNQELDEIKKDIEDLKETEKQDIKQDIKETTEDIKEIRQEAEKVKENIEIAEKVQEEE